MLKKESATSVKQKFCINANELTRRLYVVDAEDEKGEEEVNRTIEDYTHQLKNSGWERREAKEMVASGYVAWRRRLQRRVEEGSEVYRSAGSSLQGRTRKKLPGKEEWYKTKNRKRKRDEYDEETQSRRKKNKEDPSERKDRIVSVMFVPFTKGGELARRLREAEEELAKQTGIKIKIVKRTGRKIVDSLHKADPWQGQDCKREKCILCLTKLKTGKYTEQDCTNRSIIYETWCLTCEERERSRIEEETEDEK